MKKSLQDQVLEHIHRKLQERFGNAGAEQFMQRLSTRLCEMECDTPEDGKSGNAMETAGESERFLHQLNNIVYPFLALMQVLEELPTDAASETLRIWNTLPWTVVDRARRL